MRTLIDVLPFVERAKGELIGKPTEGVNQMSTQVGIDVLWQEFGLSGSIS